MKITKFTVLKDYPKTVPIPKGHTAVIYETDQLYLVEILPNNDNPRWLCPAHKRVHFDESYISRNKDLWIKIINEEDEPLEITIEFYID